MPSLNVPHLRQDKDGWCLPACVAMVAAYWGQPLLQVVMQFYQSDQTPLTQGPVGRPVEVHTYAYDDSLRRMLQSV